MTAERASYVRLMKQAFNNSELCRTWGINRKTGMRWRRRRAVKDALTARVYPYPAVPLVSRTAQPSECDTEPHAKTSLMCRHGSPGPPLCDSQYRRGPAVSPEVSQPRVERQRPCCG